MLLILWILFHDSCDIKTIRFKKMERYTLQQRTEMVNISPRTIVKLITKFEKLGQVSEVMLWVGRRRDRSAVNINADAEVSQKNSLHSILHEDLHLYAYKMQLSQKLKPTDYAQRRTFLQ